MEQPNPMYRSHLNDPSYKGEKTPKHLADGPKQDRGCTDILMLIIFIAAWGAFIYISFLGFTNGDPNKFIKPYESDFQQCGNGTLTGYPYLYFLSPSTNSTSVCVSACPNNDSTIVACSSTSQFCDSGSSDLNSPIATTDFLNLCIPTDNQYASNVTQALGITSLQKSISDLKSIWYMLFAITGIALTISFVYTILVRYCAGLMTWGILILYLVLLGAFGYVCLETANNPNGSGNVANTMKNFSQDSLKTMGIISFVALGLSAILICVFFHKIELTVAVLKCAAQMVEDLPSIILIPPIFFVILLGYSFFWLFSFIHVLALNGVTEGSPYPTINWTTTTQWETIFVVFMFIWNVFFFIAVPQFVIASASVCWYFRKASNERLGHPVMYSLCNSMWKHLGSLAFGSLILTFVEILKLMLDWIHEKVKSTTGDANPAGFALKCVACCVDCFERFIKFLNKHAYIQIAMTGENFCKAAEEAFFLIARYTVSLGLVHGIGEVFVLIGTVFITAISTLIGYILLTKTSLSTQIYSPTLPTIIFGVISYIVGSNFMSVYGTSADSIIHCYCMDDEIHESSGGPQHAPQLLKDFVADHPKPKTLNQRFLGGDSA